MGLQITSIISMAWDFTTKSGGIWKGQIKGLAKGDVLAQNRVIAQVFGLVA
jgi:hypothetical protein